MSPKKLSLILVAVSLCTAPSYAAAPKKRKPSSTTASGQKKNEKKPTQQQAKIETDQKPSDAEAPSDSKASSFGIAVHGGLILEGGSVTVRAPYTLTNPTTNLGVFAGVFADYNFSTSIGAKLGAFYQSNSYSETLTISLGALGSTSSVATFTQSWLNIPVFATYSLFDWWKLGVGGYASIGLSLSSTTVTAGVGAGTTTNSGFATNFYSSFDAGPAVLSELIFPMSPSMSVIFDGIFEYSLVNGVTATNPAISTYARYLINSTLGVRFGF